RRRGWVWGGLRAVLSVPITVLVMVAAMPGASQTKRDSGELGDKEHAIQQKQKRLREERAKAADARKREAGLLAELESIDRRLSEKRKQVALLDGRIQRSPTEGRDPQHDI